MDNLEGRVPCRMVPIRCRKLFWLQLTVRIIGRLWGRDGDARAKVECWQLKPLYLYFSLFSVPYNAKNLNYDINKFPLISKRKILKSNIPNILNALKNGNCCSAGFWLIAFRFVTLLFVLKLFAIFTVNAISHIGLGVLLSPQLSNKLPKERGSFGVSGSY